MTQARLPLERFTVLDLTRARAGPTTTRMLADWGASVIHIEQPDKPGAKGSRVTGHRHGFDYQNLHRNKRAITIDLSMPEGHALFMRLAGKADVIAENFRADVKRRLKIDYEAVSAINPGIVYGSISGFGQTGPYRDRPGLDQIAQGMGGLMSITGFPETGPVRIGIPITDLCAGMFLAQGIMMALLDREVTGKGQWVHTSLLEAMIFMLDFQAARWLQNGEIAHQVGNDHPTGVPTSCYPASDQPINIAAAGNLLFQRLCEAIGAADLAERAEYIDTSARQANRDALNAEIAAIIATRPAAHWIEVLNGAGVPCGPVNTIDQVFADPQVEHVNMVRHADHAEVGRLALVRQPVNLSGAAQPDDFRLPAPDQGEHTEQVLLEAGLERDEISALREQGVI